MRFSKTWRATAATVGLALTATGLAAAAANATPARTASASTDTTYLADTLGLPSGTIVETVTYDRFQWLLQQSGDFAFVVGSTNDAGFKAKVVAADAAAREVGATKIYWFDPNLSGQTGIKNLDVRNPGGINLAAASQTIYGNVWKNVLGQYLGNGIQSTPNSGQTTATITANDAIINDAVNPIWDYRSTATPAVTTTDDIFFVYNKDHKSGTDNDKIVDWTNLSTAADAAAAGTAVKAVIATAGGGATLDQLSQFKWWESSANRKHDLAYPNDTINGGDILDDSDDADGWRIQQITYPELLHLLQIKDSTDANFVILFGGTWCHNTRAVIKFVNQNAQDNDVPVVYNFDLVLDGGTTNGTNGGSNPIHVRDNANSGTNTAFRPSWVYGDLVRTYLRNLITEYDPNSGSRVLYYPGGDTAAVPDVVRKLQVPFLIGYQRGTGSSPSSTAIKREWIQQTTDNGSGLPTFKEYMSEWWFTQPSAQLGLSFAIPEDESTLTTGQKSQLATARLNLAFGQEAVQKLHEFFAGLPGAVASTQTVTAPSVAYGTASTVTLAIEGLYGRVPTGTATLSVNGATYPVAVSQNAAGFTTAVLPAGSYPYTITYADDDQIKGFTKTGTLEVTKTNVASIAGEATVVPTADAAGNYRVTVTEPTGLAKASGPVTLTLTKGAATHVVDGTVTNGVADLAVPTLTAGTWTAAIAYGGDTNYLASSGTGTAVSVSQDEAPELGAVTAASVIITAPSTQLGGVYHAAIITPEAQATATGVVTLTLTNGTSVRAVAEELTDGAADLPLPALPEGTWTASIAYSGDDTYAPLTAAGVDVVSAKAQAPVTATVVAAPGTQKTGSYKVALATVGLKQPTGTVTLTLTSGSANRTFTGVLASGAATFALPALPAGTWTASIAYGGDENYGARTVAGTSLVSAKVAVAKTTAAVKKAPTSKASGSYVVTVVKPTGLTNATGKVSITLKKGSLSRTYSGNLARGGVTIAVPKLPKGTWKVTVNYLGDGNYLAKTFTGGSVVVSR